MTILPSAEAAIVGHAQADAPAECCGLLLGDEDVIVVARPARNVAADTARRYEIDPADHFAAIREARALQLEVVGAYHSHPRSAPVPSPTDAAAAFGGFVFVIVGLGSDAPELRAWRWSDGNFAPVPLVRVM